MKDNIIREWDNVAAQYSKFKIDSIYSNYCKEFIINLFNNVSNFKILDAGCGDGEHTIYSKTTAQI